MTIPSPSPFGQGQKWGEVVRLNPNASKEERDNLLSNLLSTGNVLDIPAAAWEEMFNIRLPNQEKLGPKLSRKGRRCLDIKDQSFLMKKWRPVLQKTSGAVTVLRDLLSSPCNIIRKFQKIWKGIDTCLTLSFDEETHPITCFKTKWWMICARLVIQHNSTHYAASEWKSYCKFLYLHYGGSIQPLPEWKASWPKHPEGTWLLKEPGTLTRSELAQWTCLRSTRVLPCGDKVTTEKALRDHTDALCYGKDSSIDDLAKLGAYASSAAASIKSHIPAKAWKSRSGHISISNSACLEATRSQGGRRQYVLDHLKEWLEVTPTESRVLPLPTGESLIEEVGVKRYYTVKPPNLPRATEEQSRKFSSGLLTEDYLNQEQERVGFQLFAWSFYTLLEDGYIDEFGFPTGKPLPVERSTIGEPGNKVRIVTKSLAAFITYGQPWAHLFKALLEHDPSLRAGLSAGYQGYEWVKRVQKMRTHMPKYIMVGDFESSTDNIEHEAGRVAMHALCDELGMNSDYIRGYVDLLLSSRVFDHDGMTVVTKAGSLMGEPGTKIVLTFLAKVSNVYAHDGIASEFYATAGDDQIDVGDSPEVLLKYAEASRITTMKPSLDKWGVMQHAVDYCQQVLLPSVEASKAELAVPKVRLLSPETKHGRGDDEVNPAYGKAHQFRRETSWAEFPQLSHRMTILFLRNMAPHIEFSHELFTDREWGGLGLPFVPFERVWERLPEWKKCAITERENGSRLASRILARWSTSRNFERGITLQEDTAEEAYYSLIENFIFMEDDPREITGLDETVRFKEVSRAMETLGYTTVDRAVTKILTSQRYQDFWTPTAKKPSRGFKTLSWSIRTARMAKAYEEARQLQTTPASPPSGGPKWHPSRWILGSQLVDFESEDAGDSLVELEEGELLRTKVPLLGPGREGPRVFLHYTNDRLARHAGRSQRH